MVTGLSLMIGKLLVMSGQMKCSPDSWRGSKGEAFAGQGRAPNQDHGYGRENTEQEHEDINPICTASRRRRAMP